MKVIPKNMVTVLVTPLYFLSVKKCFANKANKTNKIAICRSRIIRSDLMRSGTHGSSAKADIMIFSNLGGFLFDSHAKYSTTPEITVLQITMNIQQSRIGCKDGYLSKNINTKRNNINRIVDIIDLCSNDWYFKSIPQNFLINYNMDLCILQCKCLDEVEK